MILFFFKNVKKTVDNIINKTSFRKTPELVKAVDDIDGFFLKKMSLCAVKVSVRETVLTTKTPESLLCLKRKFPVMKKNVDKALTCLNDTLCQQKTLDQAKQTIINRGSNQVFIHFRKLFDQREKIEQMWQDITLSTLHTSFNAVHDYHRINPMTKIHNKNEWVRIKKI